MKRNMRRLACVALFFFSSHPATGLSQSQKSQIWRIPVLPANDAQSSASPKQEDVVVPAREREKSFERFLQPNDDTQKSAQELSIGEVELSRSRTVNEAMSRYGLLSLGGESGAWGGGRVSMRGFPGREPEALLEGVSLGTGFTGTNALDLLPILAISSIQAYPFLPVLGLPRRGLAGAYDLSLRKGPQKHGRESLLRLEKPASFVFAHREQLGCSGSSTSPLGCVQLAWQSASRTGAQAVRDDNNTPLIGNDDFENHLGDNDLFRTGVSAHAQSNSASGIVFDTVSLFGAESRGINGLPVAQASSDNRSRKLFGLVSHRGSSLSPETGRLWRYRLDARLDSVDFSTRQNTQNLQLRKDERRERAFGFGLGFSQPRDFRQWQSRFFLHSNVEQNLYRSRFGLGRDLVPPAPDTTPLQDSTLDGRLTVADIGTGAEFIRTGQALVRLDVFAQLMSTSQNQQCGAFSPQVLCAGQTSAISQNSPGAALEAQWSLLRKVVLYGLVGRSTRLPTPAELAGRPDGVAANLDLKPESAMFIETGVHTPFAHVGAFFSRDTNLITLRQINPYLVRYFNSSKVHRGGVFGRAEVRISNFQLEAMHEYVWARAFVEGSFSQDVPFVPENLIRGSIRLDSESTLLSMSGASIALHLSRTGSYTLEPEGIYRLSPPTLLALEAASQWQSTSEALQVSLKVDNLLDTRSSRLSLLGGETRDVAWSYLPALPVMGRSLILSLKLLRS